MYQAYGWTAGEVFEQDIQKMDGVIIHALVMKHDPTQARPQCVLNVVKQVNSVLGGIGIAPGVQVHVDSEFRQVVWGLWRGCLVS